MKKRHSAEQIVGYLRQADVLLGKGQKVPEVCKQLGISEQTYYRWRTKYGGMDPQMARQLQELQAQCVETCGCFHVCDCFSLWFECLILIGNWFFDAPRLENTPCSSRNPPSRLPRRGACVVALQRIYFFSCVAESISAC